VYVPAPAPPVKKVVTVHQHVSTLKEVLIKTAEGTKKSQIKSAELIEKSNLTGKEALAKEAVEKRAQVVVPVVHHHERQRKEMESKEFDRKKEIETKLAIEKVRKEAALKEIQQKRLTPPPPPKKPCSPVSALEKYVKDCKSKQEVFEKHKVNEEKHMKELKQKADDKIEATTCNLTRKVCKKIFAVSTLRDEHIATMVKDHTLQMQKALADASDNYADNTKDMQFKICQSAANDMQWFSKWMLFGGSKGPGSPPDEASILLSPLKK